MGLFDSIFGKRKLTPGERQFVQRQSQIMVNCIKIFSETDNIETFFSRYALSEKTTLLIAEAVGGDTKCMAGNSATPNECYQMFQDEKVAHTNNFLSRYIQKETVKILKLSRGQIKKANSVAAIIDEYADQMPKESLEFGHNLCEKMIKKIEKVVS